MGVGIGTVKAGSGKCGSCIKTGGVGAAGQAIVAGDGRCELQNSAGRWAMGLGAQGELFLIITLNSLSGCAASLRMKGAPMSPLTTALDCCLLATRRKSATILLINLSIPPFRPGHIEL